MRTPIPTVTAAQMGEVDRVVTEEFGLPIVSLRENAGRGLATLAAQKLRELEERTVLCLAGKGGNGGGGLSACRHLANWGVSAEAIAVEPTLGTPAEIQARVLREAGVPVRSPASLSRVDGTSFDLVLDAILGYSGRRDPRGPVRDMVEIANGARHVVALDLPSGLDPATGKPRNPCVRAEATLTLALPKPGLLRPEATPYVGELWLGDLGIPDAVYARLGIRVPRLFRPGQIVRRLT